MISCNYFQKVCYSYVILYYLYPADSFTVLLQSYHQLSWYKILTITAKHGFEWLCLFFYKKIARFFNQLHINCKMVLWLNNATISKTKLEPMKNYKFFIQSLFIDGLGLEIFFNSNTSKINLLNNDQICVHTLLMFIIFKLQFFHRYNNNLFLFRKRRNK